jgi:hypothetical protein
MEQRMAVTQNELYCALGQVSDLEHSNKSLTNEVKYIKNCIGGAPNEKVNRTSQPHKSTDPPKEPTMSMITASLYACE